MFKDRLNEAIAYRNVSSYKIAKGTNISQATLSKYRTKDIKPNAPITKLLADYLKVNYRWLMYGDGDMLTSDVGGNIKYAMVLKGISITDFADKMNLSQGEAQKLLECETLDIEIACDISKRFDIPLEDIIGVNIQNDPNKAIVQDNLLEKMLDKKDQEIKELNREIGRLQSRIEQLEEENGKLKEE